MVNRRQMIKSAAAAATVLAMPRYAFAGSAFNGFYPAGSWMPAKQPMIQVYPRPDSETNTWARHRWAYYDGVNAVQYKIPLGVSFGAFPYVFQLLSGPPGMTIGATYLAIRLVLRTSGICGLRVFAVDTYRIGQ